MQPLISGWQLQTKSGRSYGWLIASILESPAQKVNALRLLSNSRVNPNRSGNARAVKRRDEGTGFWPCRAFCLDVIREYIESRVRHISLYNSALVSVFHSYTSVYISSAPALHGELPLRRSIWMTTGSPSLRHHDHIPYLSVGILFFFHEFFFLYRSAPSWWFERNLLLSIAAKINSISEHQFLFFSYYFLLLVTTFIRKDWTTLLSLLFLWLFGCLPYVVVYLIAYSTFKASRHLFAPYLHLSSSRH